MNRALKLKHFEIGLFSSLCLCVLLFLSWAFHSRDAVRADEKKDARKPIPSQADQAKAEAALKKTYAKEFANERGEGKLLLAAKLLQPGRKNRDDPASWLALVRVSR